MGCSKNGELIEIVLQMDSGLWPTDTLCNYFYLLLLF